MKKTNIIYWILTILICLGMLSSAIPGMIGSQQSIAFMTQLGYPAYIPMFLGIAKILGVIALLVPGFPKIREWAYAGFTFDLIGATYSLLAIKTPSAQVSFMLIYFAVLIGSYVFYHKKLKLSVN